jgi:hypothetical protein
MCSLQRPLDDKTQLRVHLEAQAILGVLAVCDSGDAALIASDVLIFEADANPNVVRRDFAAQMIVKAHQCVRTTPQVKTRSEQFVRAGIKPLDALHLSSAMEARADFFCTCDDRLIKQSRAVNTNPTQVASPIELIRRLDR